MSVYKVWASVMIYACTSLAHAKSDLDISAEKFAAAMMSRDYAQLASLSHPTLVKHFQGKQAYAAMIQGVHEKYDLKFRDMVFESYFSKQRYGDVVLAVMPYRVSVSSSAENFVSQSFYYAFSGRSETLWYFMDCAMATPDMLAALVSAYDGTLPTPGEC